MIRRAQEIGRLIRTCIFHLMRTFRSRQRGALLAGYPECDGNVPKLSSARANRNRTAWERIPKTPIYFSSHRKARAMKALPF